MLYFAIGMMTGIAICLGISVAVLSYMWDQ